jgi:branched-chain amino acid transport system substrate-binding protein
MCGLALLLLVLSFLLLVGACKPKPYTGEIKTFKIGLISSLTGVMAPAFKSEIDAAEPTADLLNQIGGITVNGQKYNIEIITEDDQSSPQGAVAAINRLMQSGIKFVVAPMFIPNNLAIGPICEENKILRMSAMAADPALFGPDNRYHFDAFMMTYDIVTTYSYLAKNYPQVKKIAIIPVDDPGAIIPREYAIKQTDKYGFEVVYNGEYPATTEDFYPVITKVLATNPDAIDGIFSMVTWGKAIIEAARDMGFEGPIMCGCGFGDINDLNNMLNPEYAYDIFQGAPDVLSDKMLPIVQDLRELVEAKTGSPLNMDNVNVLSPIMPMLQGIEEAQSFDTEKVVAAMEGLKSVNSPWGKGVWRGEDLGGLNHMLMIVDAPLSRIVNGKVEYELLKRQD